MIRTKSLSNTLRIRDILIELSKKIPLNKVSDFLHTLASAKEILYWTPKGELLFHGRRIPVTNITELADYVLLPYNEDSVPADPDSGIRGSVIFAEMAF